MFIYLFICSFTIYLRNTIFFFIKSLFKNFFIYTFIYRAIVTKFDVEKATAWRAVKRVVNALCKYRNNFIRWPNEEEANDCSRLLLMKYGFSGVIEVLDGTHIYVSTPKEDSQSYINRKGRHYIQWQVHTLI